MMKAIMAGQVRALLAAAGGYAVAKGVLPEDQVGPLTDAMVAAAPILASMAWSYVAKKRAAKSQPPG